MSKQKNILVTGAGGDIGQSVIKCLKESGYELNLTGCDIDAYAASKGEVDTLLTAPRAALADKYLGFIDSVIKKNHPDYIIPTTEPEIAFFSSRRDYFCGKTLIIINSPFIVDTYLDKYETIRFFEDNGVPHPRTYPAERYNGELSFPVLLKRRRSYGRKGLILAQDAEELDFFKKRETDMIVQELVGDDGDEYTAGVFSTGEEIYSITFRRRLGYGSLSKVACLVHDKELTRLVEKIARVSGLKGSFNVQLRKTADGYIPFEVNPRFSSTVYIRHHFGFKDVKWWLDLYEGRKIEYTPEYSAGIGVRKLSEIFFDCKPF